MELLVGITIFIMGLCIGSFINMAVYRYATKNQLESRKFKVKSKSENRSFCDYCGKQLHWYNNIPVLSWCFQAGKSQCCHKKLPLLYPLVELGTALLMTSYFVFIDSSLTLRLTLGLVLVAVMVFSTIVDLKYMILPDESTIIMILLALALFGFGNWLSAFGATAFLGILYLVTRGKGMGFGDVKLALFIGLFLGYPKIVVAFYVAFITGSIVGVVLLLLKKKGRTSVIPFGPFLLLGTLVAWWWGKSIWYQVFGI